MVSNDRLTFFNLVMEKHRAGKINYEGLQLAKDLLNTTKGMQATVLSRISENFEGLFNDDGTVRWGAEYFTDSNGDIPYKNVMNMIDTIIPCMKDLTDFIIPPDLLKDNNGTISLFNFVQYLRIVNSDPTHGLDNDFIAGIAKLKEIKDKNGDIDENITKFINKNVPYCRKTPQILKPSEVLKETLRLSKNEDDSINWDIADSLIKTVSMIFRETGAEIPKSVNTEKLTLEALSYCSRLEGIIKEDGKFSKERIDLINDIVKSSNGRKFLINALKNKNKSSELFMAIKHISSFDTDDINTALKPNIEKTELLYSILNDNTLDTLTEGKNLYKSEELLEVLEKMNDAGILDSLSLIKPIKNFDNLFWAIIEAPRTEENKESYSKIIKLLSGIKNVDYNQKDSNGISVLEKVIMAENEELLDTIIKSSSRLDYYPELDLVYEGIQSEKFKKQLSNLNLWFKDIEDALNVGSVNSLKKLKLQFETHLCTKEKIMEQCLITLSQRKLDKNTEACSDYLIYAYCMHRDVSMELLQKMQDIRTKSRNNGWR